MTPPERAAKARDYFGALADALLDPALAPPAGLVSRGGSLERRFAVHRNTVVASLIDALRARFVVCARLVGDEFFSALARAYVRARPPTSPLLGEYGDGFADFVADFEPAAAAPYLADVARLEYAAGCAYHAADAQPLGADAFTDLAPDRLDRLRIALHPSLRLLASPFPIGSIWRTNMFDAQPRIDSLERAEQIVVLRPRLEVDIHIVTPAVFAFLTALNDSLSLADAAQAAQAAASENRQEDPNTDDLADSFRFLIANGAAVAILDSN